jgi:hypothetical protein
VAGISPMVSLRIPEDHLLELNLRVGLDGLRNRSDVIREAVRRYLSSPLPTVGERVEVDLGPDLTVRLREFCKLQRFYAKQPGSTSARQPWKMRLWTGSSQGAWMNSARISTTIRMLYEVRD